MLLFFSLLLLIIACLIFIIWKRDKKYKLEKEKILKSHQEISQVIDVLIKNNQDSTKKIENSTLNTIEQFQNLLEKLNQNIEKTNDALDSIRKKISIIVTTDKNEDASVIQQKYEEMLKEIMDQLSMTIERKSEDIAKLDSIKIKIDAMYLVSKQISGLFSKMKMLAINARIHTIHKTIRKAKSLQ